MYDIIKRVNWMGYDGGPMTEAMYYVLLTLMNPNHGYQLMHSITEVSNGRLHMGPGTLYGVLSRMQKEGLIVLEEDDGRRKTYKVTTEGKSALRTEYNRLRNMVRDGSVLKEGD
jgi:DNA-binding PadR family transcriptional regulator